MTLETIEKRAQGMTANATAGIDQIPHPIPAACDSP